MANTISNEYLSNDQKAVLYDILAANVLYCSSSSSDIPKDSIHYKCMLDVINNASWHIQVQDFRDKFSSLSKADRDEVTGPLPGCFAITPELIEKLDLFIARKENK